MDKEYKPDGWLGILVRGKLYHKFYSADHVDSNMEGLLKDIAGALSPGDNDDEVDGKLISMAMWFTTQFSLCALHR